MQLQYSLIIFRKLRNCKTHRIAASPVVRQHQNIISTNLFESLIEYGSLVESRALFLKLENKTFVPQAHKQHFPKIFKSNSGHSKKCDYQKLELKKFHETSTFFLLEGNKLIVVLLGPQKWELFSLILFYMYFYFLLRT